MAAAEVDPYDASRRPQSKGFYNEVLYHGWTLPALRQQDADPYDARSKPQSKAFFNEQLYEGWTRPLQKGLRPAGAACSTWTRPSRPS